MSRIGRILRANAIWAAIPADGAKSLGEYSDAAMATEAKVRKN